MTDFTGRWTLLGAVSHDPDVAYESEDEIRMDAVIGGTRLDLELLLHKWLAGETFDAEPPLGPASGLTLDIGDDDTFTESGTAEVEWFCEEGVLEAKALPFDGRIVTTPAGSHLLLHERWDRAGLRGRLPVRRRPAAAGRRRHTDHRHRRTGRRPAAADGVRGDRRDVPQPRAVRVRARLTPQSACPLRSADVRVRIRNPRSARRVSAAFRHGQLYANRTSAVRGDGETIRSSARARYSPDPWNVHSRCRRARSWPRVSFSVSRPDVVPSLLAQR